MQTLLEYTLSYEGQHVITPLAILVECVSTLCCVTHHLDPSANKMKLGQQMRIRINILIANQDWDALYIFAKMIDGQTSVRRGAHGLGAAHLETDEATNKMCTHSPAFIPPRLTHCPVHCEETPTATLRPTTLVEITRPLVGREAKSWSLSPSTVTCSILCQSCTIT